jgi:hypothetical protein
VARPAAYGGGGMPAWQGLPPTGVAACLRGKGAGMGGGGMPRHHLILPHSILQKPNRRIEPFRSSNFSEPNTGSEPFHALGMEPFHSVLPGSRTEHILSV